jgi:ribosome-associated toxin RatA of RatAB toxin-antitoxin module
MQAVRRLLRTALSLWLVASLPAPALAADPEVSVAAREGRCLVSSSTPVAAAAEVAWQVISDYNRLAEFVPDLRLSRVISAPGEPLLVEQAGEAGFLLFRFSINVVLKITEAAPQRLEFRAIRGNMRSMHGDWRIGKTATGILLEYSAELEPSFWVPPLIGPAIMRRDIAAQIGGVVREIERRQAALVPLPTTPPEK